jgi:hypothetical protein
MAPAIVQGNTRRAIAYFIEDTRGNLVDIEYECCGNTPTEALPWPGYSFSADYSTYCRKCRRLVQRIR